MAPVTGKPMRVLEFLLLGGPEGPLLPTTRLEGLSGHISPQQFTDWKARVERQGWRVECDQALSFRGQLVKCSIPA